MSKATRCPACATTFKVVDDQLKMSDGWVRCGNCRQIFDATAHWLPVSSPTTSSAPLFGQTGQTSEAAQASASFVQQTPFNHTNSPLDDTKNQTSPVSVPQSAPKTLYQQLPSQKADLELTPKAPIAAFSAADASIPSAVTFSPDVTLKSQDSSIQIADATKLVSSEGYAAIYFAENEHPSRSLDAIDAMGFFSTTTGNDNDATQWSEISIPTEIGEAPTQSAALEKTSAPFSRIEPTFDSDFGLSSSADPIEKNKSASSKSIASTTQTSRAESLAFPDLRLPNSNEPLQSTFNANYLANNASHLDHSTNHSSNFVAKSEGVQRDSGEIREKKEIKDAKENKEKEQRTSFVEAAAKADEIALEQVAEDGLQFEGQAPPESPLSILKELPRRTPRSISSSASTSNQNRESDRERRSRRSSPASELPRSSRLPRSTRSSSSSSRLPQRSAPSLSTLSTFSDDAAKSEKKEKKRRRTFGLFSELGSQLPSDLAAQKNQLIYSEFTTSNMPSEFRQMEFFQDVRKKAFWAKPAVRVATTAVAILSALLLLGQIVWVERNRLAAWQPSWKPPLQAVCKTLGCQIQPWRQLDAVLIDSSAFNKVKGEDYVLSLSLNNTSKLPIATPAVELTLTDQQEQPILRKILMPQDLGAPNELTASTEWTGSVPVVITGAGNLNIAGYRFLIFYP